MTIRKLQLNIRAIQSPGYRLALSKAKIVGELMEDTPEGVEEVIRRYVGKEGVAGTLHVNRWSTLGEHRHAQLDLQLVDGSCFTCMVTDCQ